ncbi:TonB-dependent receptor [Niabella aurantiaca]|uniref:TonB-dependent receptor n=1 Tax=Niabella aurantiaca TaxID=379900 RepID=UPI000374555E|nr:TonB-dependent receptor [Niabella aurantiaca]
MNTRTQYFIFGIVLFLFLVLPGGRVCGQASLMERKITLVVKNESLKKVLGYIEKKLSIRFTYSNSEVDVRKVLTLEMVNKPLDAVLKSIADKTGVAYELVNDVIILRKAKSPEPSRNSVMITGKVVDENGAAVAGATVAEKGTSMATSAAADGNFSLNVTDYNATVEVSNIGFMNASVPLEGQKSLTVALQADDRSMDNVVVVGYGSQKKSVVTGAISSIKARDISNQQVTRVEQALQGRTSGLTIASSSGSPGAAATVRVRGATSLSDGASNPLYVVDGTVIPGSNIDYLSTGDIESIEVLKDAASAAIYGARSSAGVILVTTKKGKAGGLVTNYNNYLGLQRPAKRLNMLNATEYGKMLNEQSLNSGGKVIFANPDSLGAGTNWQDQIFNNHAFIQSHELNLSGGGDRSTFFSSFSYFDQQGIITTSISSYQRYSLRLNSTHRIRKWLSLGQNLGFSHTKSKGVAFSANTEFNSPMSAAINLDPVTPVLVTDESSLTRPPYSTQPDIIKDKNGRPYGISSLVSTQFTNPVAYVKTREGNYDWSDDLVGNLFLEMEPLKGIKLRSNIGTKLSYSGSEVFTPKFYLAANQINTANIFTRIRDKIFNWNLENTLSFNRRFGAHDLTLLLGQGAYLDNNASGLTVTYAGIPATNFKDATMNYNVAADQKTASGFEGILHKVNSLFARGLYSYNDKYLFTGIIRRDGSSRFGPNKKFGYFPSASLGWVLSKEPFFNVPQFGFLKLRASYGVTGNDVLGDLRYAATVSGGRNYVFGNDSYLVGYSPDAPANADLQWEETSQLNLGFDARIFTHISLTVDGFRKETKGILMPVEFPAYVGATGTGYANIGNMENKGVELELGYNNDFNGFKVDVNGNVSYLQNRVTFLGDGKRYTEDGTSRLTSSAYPLTRIATGHAINSFYGFKTNGIFQNQAEVEAYTGPKGKIQPNARPGDFRWADLDHDGTITEADRTFIGDPTPNWSFGATVNAGWKDFDLLIFGQGVAGNQIFQGLRRHDVLPNANWQTTVYQRWHGEGTSNSYPRLTNNDTNKNLSYPSVFYLENGSYFRIKTLQLGYNLSSSGLNGIGINKLRLYVSGSNLVTVTKYSGYDPEIGGNSYGIDRGVYPQAKSFLIGLNVSF